MNKMKDFHTFRFDLDDAHTPDQVVKDCLQSLEEETHGYVTAHVQEYTKHYDEVSNTKDDQEHPNVQSYLGAVNDQKKTYEIYLSVKGIPNFKYRMMFLEFGEIAYPAGMVLSDEISTIITSVYEYRYAIESVSSLQHVMDKILNSNYFHVLIQNFINEGLRREKEH